MRRFLATPDAASCRRSAESGLDSFDQASRQTISRLFYNTFFQGIDFHCNVMDRDYRIVWHNRVEPEARRLGMFCYEFYYRRTEPCAQHCAARNVFVSGKPCFLEREMFDRLSDGRPRWAEIRAYPIREQRRHVEFVVTVGFEITARKYGADHQEKTAGKAEGGTGMASGAPRTVTPQKGGTFSSLTERELQVLSLMAEGCTNLDIAHILCLSPHTVKSHTVHIYNKLGVNDRTAAAIMASRLNLI